MGAGDELAAKIIAVVPGDSWRLATSSRGGIWNIVVNELVLTNSENVPYEVDIRAYTLLSLYEKDYGRRMPSDTYMLLGNLPSGSADSRKFGLIDKKDILGKVTR
jgi:type IV secretory pathway protease TraF